MFLISVPKFPLAKNSTSSSDPSRSRATRSKGSIKAAKAEIANLHLVAPGIVRGAQPTPEGLELLRECGVKTIINLRNEEVIVNREAADAERLGMRFVNIPLDVFVAPSAVAISDFMDTIHDPRNQPVFVHCQHGQERTGTMIGLYRIHHEGWSGGQAYEEMLRHGFRPAFFNLGLAVMDYFNARQSVTPEASKRGSVVNLLGRSQRFASKLLNRLVRLHKVRKDPVEYSPVSVIRI
jgi:tyrosine-protein phosphatase SIW14